MQFSKLRLSGFKSFVETTELVIEPGLTGIVGPNGCGKSNLIDALRWGMGEHSARQLRGAEMDDVIFAGTQNRPPRNIAEVGIVLENDKRTAPAQFNDQDEIEIVRRIERESGSAYRVNGAETRQRDVQTLFADAATDLHSAHIELSRPWAQPVRLVPIVAQHRNAAADVAAHGHHFAAVVFLQPRNDDGRV